MSKKVTNANLKISDLIPSIFDEEMAKKAVRGRYKAIIEDVVAHNRYIKVEGLTKGQVAALGRVADDNEVRWKADYKNGYVLLGPEPKVKKTKKQNEAEISEGIKALEPDTQK